MQCNTHPGVEAFDRCAGCAEPFCPNCLVEIHGESYCGACKVLTIRGKPQALEELTEPCQEANIAFILAMVSVVLSIFCCGLILGPVAIVRGAEAMKLINENPRLTGSGKALAAIIVGVTTFGMSVFFFALLRKLR
jgi:hypothetical protein